MRMEQILKQARLLKAALDEGELLVRANTWEVRHSGFSGRTARQFVDYLGGLDRGAQESPASGT